ncbi:hypothetical protein pneo_cds_525 [Pandoravirus neocaledonia]|uniref:Uncharacterized protein n=1 Tax=Pandoravirus neocaledonia TaxID=2107708 RepID=A0A2U7UCL1_9VIRU|nr:hypothetical protein pneo_cds_525 [Pandoravirus neocaledonia]AVK76132.1 hypothetical protein pneo_cds_525 [Pandoravirus neocaledonia]
MTRRQHKPTPIASTRVMLSASKAKAALLAHAARQKALRDEALAPKRCRGTTSLPASTPEPPPPPLCYDTRPRDATDCDPSAQSPTVRDAQRVDHDDDGEVEQKIATLTATIEDICRRIKVHTSSTVAVPRTSPAHVIATAAAPSPTPNPLPPKEPDASQAPPLDDDQRGRCGQPRTPRIICGPVDCGPPANPSVVFWWE